MKRVGGTDTQLATKPLARLTTNRRVATAWRSKCKRSDPTLRMRGTGYSQLRRQIPLIPGCENQWGLTSGALKISRADLSHQVRKEKKNEK